MLKCEHVKTIPAQVSPSAVGCEDCLRIGSSWLHLRLCCTCGHVGCCDNSPNLHARAHWQHHRDHAVIEGYDPPEGWGWCYVDQEWIDLPNQTAQRGAIPHYDKRPNSPEVEATMSHEVVFDSSGRRGHFEDENVRIPYPID